LSDNLPANLETLSAREMMEMTGQKQEMSGNGLPVLRVNYDDQDKEGVDIPRGQWTVVDQEGIIVYAKEVQFVPMYATYQYSHFDADLGKQVSVSVHFQKWSEEVPDTAGGFKCGKLPRKEVEKLTGPEKDAQRKIKLSRVVFGLVSLTGTTKQGVERTVTNLPVVFYARGSNYMPMEEFLNGLADKNIMMQTVVANLALKREKNNGVTYWEVVPTVAGDRKITRDDFDAVRQFDQIKRNENDSILDKFNKAKTKGTRKADEMLSAKYAGKVIEGTATSLEDDLNDSVTILGAG
jgi:hypothetical protein